MLLHQEYFYKKGSKDFIYKTFHEEYYYDINAHLKHKNNYRC